MDHVKPNFLIIGVQKSATTWLAKKLKEHPEIFIPDLKELHFFNVRYSQGMGWYMNQFNGYNGEKMIGEATPDYFGCESCPSLIKKELTDIKLIVILRNPVDRAYSAFNMTYPEWKHRNSFIKIFFQTMNDKNPSPHSEYKIPKNTMYTYGLYSKHLKNWHKFFNEKKIKVGFYDDLLSNPKRFFKDILNFLEVNSNFYPSDIEKRIHSSKTTHQLFFVLKRKIVKYMSFPPVIALLKKSTKIVPVKLMKDWLLRFSLRKELKKNDRIKIYEVYKGSIKELEKMTGRDLSNWKP